MITKNFGEIKRLDESGEGQAVFAQLNTPDKDNDILLPGAIGRQVVVPMSPAHNWKETPIGKACLREEGQEVIADFQMNLNNDLGKEWHSALQFDMDHLPPPKQQWSYAFDVNMSSFGEFEGKPVRFLKKITIHELSPVILGAGINTRTLSLKDWRATTEKPFARVEKTLERARIFSTKLRFEELERRYKEMSAKRYREIQAVDDWLFDSSYILARMAAKECGVKLPDIKFFREAKSGERVDFSETEEINGWAPQGGNVIWLKDGRGGSGFISTVAHEVKHVSQPVAKNKEEYDSHEQEAREYGNQFASRFGRIPDDAKIFIYKAQKKLDPLFTLIDDANFNDRLIDVTTSRLYRRGRNDSQAWWHFEKTINFGGEI